MAWKSRISGKHRNLDHLEKTRKFLNKIQKSQKIAKYYKIMCHIVALILIVLKDWNFVLKFHIFSKNLNFFLKFQIFSKILILF